MDRGLSTFKTVFLELIGSDATASQIADFLSSRVGGDASAVRAYMVTTPAFVKKYSVIVRSLYVKYHNEDPCEEVVQEYLNGMRDPGFDIEAAIKSKNANKNTNTSTNTMGTSTLACASTTSSLLSQIPLSPLDPSPTVIVKEAELDEDAVLGFEDVAHRPMSVYEYFKYVVDNTNKSAVAGTDWAALWKHQVEVYNRIRNIMHDYCELTMTEHEFLREHLVAMDEPDFDTQFIDEIVNSDAYATQMKSKLRKIYKETFDTDMSQVDVDYLFASVKATKASLSSAELRGIVVDFYKATNNIIAHASEVYNKVVDRYPDSVELVDVVAMYRANSHRSMDDIAIELERSLVKSLEFHDVLRARIQKAATVNGKNLIPSKLYGIMQKLLVKVDTLTMDALPGEITKLLD